jgi:hypothetical protein
MLLKKVAFACKLIQAVQTAKSIPKAVGELQFCTTCHYLYDEDGNRLIDYINLGE